MQLGGADQAPISCALGVKVQIHAWSSAWQDPQLPLQAFGLWGKRSTFFQAGPFATPAYSYISTALILVLTSVRALCREGQPKLQVDEVLAIQTPRFLREALQIVQSSGRLLNAAGIMLMGGMQRMLHSVLRT
jgi:hypothetical protein